WAQSPRMVGRTASAFDAVANRTATRMSDSSSLAHATRICSSDQRLRQKEARSSGHATVEANACVSCTNSSSVAMPGATSIPNVPAAEPEDNENRRVVSVPEQSIRFVTKALRAAWTGVEVLVTLTLLVAAVSVLRNPPYRAPARPSAAAAVPVPKAPLSID